MSRHTPIRYVQMPVSQLEDLAGGDGISHMTVDQLEIAKPPFRWGRAFLTVGGIVTGFALVGALAVGFGVVHTVGKATAPIAAHPTGMVNSVQFTPALAGQYIPQGHYWEGAIVFTNTSGHSAWNGFVVVRDDRGDTCANAPYQGGVWKVSLGPSDVRVGADHHVVAVQCMMPAVGAIPPSAHAFRGYWSSRWPSGSALLVSIDNPIAFVTRSV
jgi:hypothetical protein